ncbi:Sensor histidine kinase LiaS [subsurface metagenome]
MIDTSINSVRDISSRIRPALLDKLSLSAAVEWAVEEFRKHDTVQCSLIIEPDEIEGNNAITTFLFRLVQEALTNISRHACATEANVCLKTETGTLRLLIEDNGKGITEDKIADPDSYGITGMREHCLSFGGEFRIGRKKDGGTRIEVIIPAS